MTNISGNQKTICRESIKCYYKADGTCTFRKNVEAMLSVLQGKYHKGSNYIENLADTYNLSCIDLDEDGLYSTYTPPEDWLLFICRSADY